MKRRRSARRWLLPLLALVLLAALLLYSTDAVRPFAEALMMSQASIMCNLAVNQAVADSIGQLSGYEALVELVYDASGRICALRSQAAAVNRLRAQMTEAVNRALSALPSSTIGIPIGTVTGWEWLSGRGPKVSMKMIPSSYTTVTMENVFDSAGINQTRHQILFHFKVSLTALLTPYSVSTDVTVTVCVAETVIVGVVPEMFAGLT